jgi:hypothetical protein
MKRYLFFAIIWALSSSLVCSDNNNDTIGVFSVKIALQADGSIFQLIAYCKNGDRITNKRFLTEQEFIQYSTGNWSSIYNPERINYLRKYNLNCGFIIDEFSRQQLFGCMPLDSLWKIRYSSYPYHGVMESGWAGTENGPTEGQLNYLKERYNVSNLNIDAFADSNLYKLLYDVMDSTWIANYKFM